MSAGLTRRQESALHSRRTPLWLFVLRSLTTPESVLAVLLVGVLAILPLRDGSILLDAQAINAVLVASLVMALEVSLLVRGKPHALPAGRVAAPAVLFGLGMAWVFVQMLPIGTLSLEHPAWSMVSDLVGQPTAGRISVDPDLTAQGLLRLATAAGMVWLAAQLATDPARAYALLSSLLAVQIAYAAYAFATNGVAADSDLPTLSATFSNRNTYATYVGMGVVVAVALTWRMFRHASREGGRSVRLIVARILERVGGQGIFWVGAAVLLCAALLLTGSRGGLLSCAAALVVLTVLSVRRQGRRRSLVGTVVTAAAALAMLLLLFGIAFIGFGDILVGRMSASGLSDAGRPYVYATTWQAIMSSPRLGYGYGTFAAVFPMFDDGSGDPFIAWDLAHNTYLEVLLGSGIPGGLLLIAPVVWLAALCLKGAATRQYNATVPAIAVSASVLVGLHALVDFSLQYPGVGLTYAALLGIGVAQSAEPAPAPRARTSRDKSGQATKASR